MVWRQTVWNCGAPDLPSPDVIATYSLQQVLEMEVRLDNFKERKAATKKEFSRILDRELPGWLRNLKVRTLPPERSAMIQVFNNLVSRFEPIEQSYCIPLHFPALSALDALIIKLKLLFRGTAGRLPKEKSCSNHFDRPHVLYCGFCNDETTAESPMTIQDFREHLKDWHPNERWKQNMVREPPAGFPVFDATCCECGDAILVDAEQGESHSGLRCSDCGYKNCFQCMDQTCIQLEDYEIKGPREKNMTNGRDWYLCKECLVDFRSLDVIFAR
jgi:hypothetical protein